ncbi:MAG: 30S ribosomal protein S12 methylthiotransferase RimO [Clostridiales bacterium]|nr:30S ribosomal protein S12 methylthiotransferase RimO [Clostridiales bacterium]
MKLFMVSLGCDKNLVDSERMLSLLADHGFELTDDENEAEVAVVNTCCFIDEAKKESIDQIFELANLKKTACLRVLVAAGCMAQRYRDEILQEIPEIDATVGTTGLDGIADAVDAALRGQKNAHISDISKDPPLRPGRRVLTTGGHFAYLKIAEGCDKHCTYCAIPSFRGAYRSFPMEDLITEAEEIASRGVRELILVAQETTLYGTDLTGRPILHELLKRLCRIEGIEWIRILYCYPEDIYPELIDVMASEPKICHYLDLPIQSGSDSVLKRMNRHTTSDEIRRLVGRLRERMPDIVLRTTLITGFPGETEEEADETLAFVRDMKFDRLGVFMYSREEGTPAAQMKPQLTKAVKKRRMDAIMSLQQGISLEKNIGRKGMELDVFVEGSLPEEDGLVYAGRGYGDAPQVDGFIFFTALREHVTGDFVRVRVTEASAYDLRGEEIGS